MSIHRNIVSKFCALASKREFGAYRFVFERSFERRVEKKVSSPLARFSIARLSLIALGVSLASASQSFAQIWISPITAQGNRGTYVRGDALGDWWVQTEIGQSSWNASEIGIGTNSNGSTGWNFAASSYYQDGPSPNKRVQRNLNGYRFTAPGNYFIIHRAKANSGDSWTAKSAPGWVNSTTYPPTDMNTTSGTYFVANELPNPTSVTLSGQSTTGITVNWARGVNGATSYDTVVVRHTATITDPTQGTTYNPASSPNTTAAGTVVYRGNGTSFTDSSLSPGTSYFYKVYAENWSYYSPGVSTNSATIPSAPAAPTASLLATTSFTANWVAPSGGATTSYRLDVATDSGFTSFVSGYNGKTVSGTSDSVTGLTAGTTYYVRVRAVSAGGTSASSSTLTQITVPSAPATPTSASVGTTSFVVNWSAVTGATSYKLDVATDSGFTSFVTNYNDVTATSGTTVSGLAAGTTYYVRVRAVNSGGTSASSSTLTQATTAASAVISSSGTPGALSTTYGTASSSTSFSVSGTSMAAGILVTPPSGFEVSTNNSTFSSTVTVGAAGTIASTTVYVRLTSTAVPASYSGNIVLTSSGASNVNVATTSSTVNTKALTISSAAVTTKVYDRTTTATITGSLSGVNGSDVVTLSGTGTFNTAAVGTGKSVTSTSTLGGANASYYTLTQPTGLTGNITAAPLTVTGASATNKTYDRSTTITVTGGSLSGVISGDTVTLSTASAAGSVASAAVGTGKAVTVTGYSISGTDSGNYSLTQPSLTVNITAKALTITGATATDRVYNGSTTVTVSGGSLSGVIAGDTVTLGGTPTGSIATATVGSGKAVTVSGYSISGTDSGNYSLTQPSLTVNITQATPSITAAPTASGIKYAQTLASSTLSGGTASVAGSFAWTTSSTVAAPGANSYSVTFTPTDTTNYTTTTTNVSVTSTIAQARNTAGAASPTQPSAIYLGDTNRTFGADTWGTIDGAYGRGRLFVRHSNSNVLGGSASPWTDFVNTDTKTITNSPQFTNTGTWFWGIQMDYGATYGTNFWYKASTNGWSDMSTNDVGSTLSVTVQALPNPTSVTASNASTTSVALTWARGTASGNTYDTVVVRHTSSSITDPTQGTTYNPGGTPVNTGAGTVVYRGSGTNYTDTSLTQGTTYYYKVYAENWNYYSTGVSTNATPSTTPGTPTSVVITPGDAQLSVAFTAPSNGGSAITDYEYSTDGGTSFKSAATTSSPITITTVSASSASLVNGTPYNVQIRARNANGVGTATASSSATPVTTPGAPTITGITAGSGQLSVAFTAPSSTGGSAITNYEYSTNNGSSYTAVSPASTASPIVITGLSNGTSYTVRIRAVNAIGSGTASSSSSGTPVAAPTLNAVTLGSALTNTYGTASTGVSFTASGTDLSANITATAQSGFEVSTSLSSGYGSSVSVASGTTVYVRFAARRAAGSHNSTTAAVLSSTGASNVNVTTSSSGNTVAQKGLTISGATATNREYNATTTVAVSGGSLVGVETGDTVTLGGTPTGTVSTATVAAGKAVTVTGYSISGTDSGNYSLAQPTGVTVDITKATPSVTTAPTASGIYYAQTLAASSLTGGTVSPSGGTWAWTTPATVATPGTASYSATYTPTDTTNYNTTTTNVSLTSSMAQARNTGGSATPGAPSSIYLGDTNRTFTSETWGSISGTNGSARLVIRYSNADLTGGVSQGFATADSNDTNSLTSLQFTNTGTWYWGVQMNYGSPFGSNFWYKTSTAGWSNMATDGTAATLNVTVLALPNPSSVAFSSTATNQTTIGWTAATAGGNTYQTIVVRHSSSNITDPTQGTNYSTSDSTGGGTVVYKGFATNFTDTGLSASTSYFYKVYAENWNYYSSGTATNVTTLGVPAITIGGATNASATAFTNTYGTASAAQQFTIAASNLTANITATAPTGFEVSTNGTTYGSTATFTQTSGSASGTLYVRLAATATVGGTYNSQNITLASTGATTRNITTASSGNTVNRKTITVTANDQSVVFGTAVATVTGAGSVSYTGFENGDTSSVITGTPTYTTTYTTTTAASTAGVTITPVITGLTATNYSFSAANGTITVTALNNPGSLTVSKNSTLPMTSVNLSWSKASNRDVLIVRDTADSWTAPTVGTAYSAGQTIGTGTVVYKGAGTSTTDNGLIPGTTYFYRFYSENDSSYSSGVTGSSVTLDAVQARNASGAASPSVTLTNGSNATLYVGDQARFSFDATGTIPSSTDTNWGQPRLRLKFNDADLSTGTIGTTNTANGGFTDLTNKTIIATNRFTNSGTWYWGMQMSYGSPYGSAFWYKASSSSYANMAADGTGSSLSFTVTALPDPSGVTVTSPSPTTNTISFTRTGRSGGEFAAVVVRKAGSAVDWTPSPGTTYTNGFTTNGNVVVDAANFSTSVSDTGLSAGTTYHYKVFSENWGYYSAGATSSVTTVPSAPAAPTSSAITATNFTATWVNPGGATNYFLDVSTASNFATFVSGYSNKAVATTSDSISGLSANTTYYVRVRAQSSGGTSASSASLTQLTAPGTPSEPTAASVLATSFTVNWAAVTGATGYRLDVATDSGFTSFVSGFENKTVSGLTDSLSGLSAGVTYYVRVRAVNSGGTGANSPTLTVSTAASATAPSITGITPGNGTLSVAFTAGESGGLTINNYEYSTDNGSNYTAVSPASTASPILISGLSNGTSYTVRIRAVNSDTTTGTASAGVSSTPRTTPGAPTGLTVTPGSTQLTASFTAPASDGGSAITNYEYSTNGGTNFTAVSPASTSTSITITGLSNGTAYNVQVRAVNAAGSGTATASVSATPRTTPTVTTGASSSVAAYSAALAGNITATGGANATARGIEYSTTSGFTTGTGTQTSSSGDFSTGAFTNSATNLASGTTYYYRAFASNSAGISYGAQSNFTTLVVPGGKDPATANATSAFLGDTLTLNIDAWQTHNGTNRSFVTVFGRYDNADLSISGSLLPQGAGRDPGSSADAVWANTPQFTNTGTFYWTMRVSYGANNDFFYDALRPGWSDLALSRPSVASLSIAVSALNNPAIVSATSASSSSVDLTWTRGTSGVAKDTVIVRRAGSAVATDPTQGTAYSANDSLGSGTVVYRGSGTNFTDTGLVAGTTYHYKLYAENWSYYSTGVTTNVSTAGNPTITISGLTNNVTTAAFTTTYGTPSASQSFTIGGSNLTTNIVATAPTGFQVSTNDSTYTNSVTFTQSSGSASGTLYLRLSGSANAGDYNSASVTLSSTGATNRTITTPSTGNTVAKATPTSIVLPTVGSSIIKGDTLYNGLLSGGSANVGGTFGFSDTSTRQTGTGNKTLTFTPTDTTNYLTISTNVSVTVDPVPDPTGVTATNTGTTNSINLTHNRTSNRNVMIVRRAGSAVDWTPTEGTTYTNGFTTNGHTVVHGSLAQDTSTDSGLAPATTYHYKIFSENWGYYSAGQTASATTATPSPTLIVSGTPGAMSTTYGTASSTSSSFSFSGSFLSGNVTVTAPSGFEVSSGGAFGDSVTITPSSGTVGTTSISVRIKSSTNPGSPSGNVSVASTGATTQNVAVSGTVSIPAMSMTIASPAGSMNADYTTSKLYADELAGTTNNVTISFNTGNSAATEVEVWTNLNNRDRANNDANSDSIPDGLIPPDPATERPSGDVSGPYPSNGYFQAHPMSNSSGTTYTVTINANKTGAYRLTARYRVSGGRWVYYNEDGAKRDHAITVTPVLARNMNVYEINVLNINATGSDFNSRSTFESLTNSANGRVNLDYLRNMGVNTLWFQPVHPNGSEGREAPGGTPYDPGSPYAVKNFFEVMEQMSQGNNRGASMTAFTNFVAAADTKGVNVMLDAPFNHTAYDCELDEEGLSLMAAAGLNTSGWAAGDAIKSREARFYSKNNAGSQYAGPASSAGNVAAAPDRNDFGKWNDVIDVYFGRYSSLVTGNPASGAALNKYKNEEDTIVLDDLRGGAGTDGAVTRAVWQYFARYVPYWLEKTGLPAGSSTADQATKGVDGLRADFGQGMPPQFWEYVINVAREHKWSFVFMSESLDGGEVTYRSNRHFDILNENIVFPWQQATATTAHRTIFEDRRNAYGQGLVLLNNTSHDEAGYADPWEAFIRYAVGGTMDGAPMIMYGQEIGTGASLSFDHYEVNFGKSIPHFKRWNSMNPQWTAWGNNSLGVKNLMPNYSGVGLAREFSPALRSSNRWFLNPIGSGTADPDIFAVAKYETANASPSTSDVVLAFVNLRRDRAEANTFGIPAGLGTALGIEANKYYNVKNIAAYLGPNNEYPNRRNEWLWNTPRLGSDILSNGIFVSMNGVPNTDGGWTNAPYEAQYLKLYAAPSITTSGTPTAVTNTFSSNSPTTSFTLSGTDIHEGMTIAAPNGFQVSTNASSGFANSITLTNTGTIASITIYTRLNSGNDVGSYSGSVTLSSPGGLNTSVALPTSSVTAAPLPATTFAQNVNGSFTATASGITNWSYSYVGRTNGVSGFNTNYAFMSFSNTTNPTLPGFYRVTARPVGRAATNYTGSAFEDYAIAGPLYREIITTRSGSSVTNNLTRSTLMSAVQRVTTNSTLSTGTNGLSWTNPIAGFSTMASGATNPNSVSYLSASTIRLFVTNTNSIVDTLSVVISDGSTPITFPVTVTPTNGAVTNVPTLTLTVPPVNTTTTVTHTNFEGVAPGTVFTNTIRLDLMARPNRPITVQFQSGTNWFHVTKTNLPFISATNQPATNSSIRPVVFTPRTGKITLTADPTITQLRGRATNN